MQYFETGLHRGLDRRFYLRHDQRMGRIPLSGEVMSVSAKILALAMTPTDLGAPLTLKKALLFLLMCLPGAAAVALGIITLVFYPPPI
jgi:hypothetical protein